ncbi:hypothetical protein B0H19DRAFT_1328838 [Mycena capillaripes]|nr:hypothetical protein B0H19DRAFT_1328838 [Mycena capillaripes]
MSVKSVSNGYALARVGQPSSGRGRRRLFKIECDEDGRHMVVRETENVSHRQDVLRLIDAAGQCRGSGSLMKAVKVRVLLSSLHSMPPARITDLPTEILVDIFEHPTFPTESLYFLALLCRRLNFIALPIYFSRNEIDLDSDYAVVSLHADQLDVLSALHICLSISSMERIEFIFPHPSCISIFPFLKQMKRVETFISRLSSVKEVSLTLDRTSKGRCLALGTDEVLHAWATQLRDLLSCIVERGCISLTVINGTHLTEAYQLNSLGAPQKYLSKVLQRLLLPQDTGTLGFRRNPRQGTDDALLSIPLFADSRLKSLRIDSATLILPPGLHWTLTVLRHSPITSLSMSMSLAEPRVWTTVLPLIASSAPNLTAVSLTELASPSRYKGAPDESLAFAFLASLPRLTDIELTHLQPFWGYHIGRDPHYHRYIGRRERTTAPHKYLTTLRAPANVVAHLLSRPGSLSAIRAICERTTPPHKYLITLRAPANVVAHLLSRPGSLSAIRRICVLWDSPTPAHFELLMGFLSSIAHTLAARRLAPRLSLCIESLRLGEHNVTVIRELSSTQLAHFARVEQIELQNALPVDEYDPQPFLAPLVAAFRGVKHMSITTCTPASEAPAVRLVREVGATQTLKSIEVNGQSYDLTQD